MRALAAVEYNQGFKNPSGESPLERRASFNRLTIDAKVGVAAEVPPMRIACPCKNILKLSAIAATSGMAFIGYVIISACKYMQFVYRNVLFHSCLSLETRAINYYSYCSLRVKQPFKGSRWQRLQEVRNDRILI